MLKDPVTWGGGPRTSLRCAVGVLVWVICALSLSTALGEPLDREDAASAAASPEWTTRLAAARVLLAEGAAEDTSTLTLLAGDPELAVAQLAMDGLARLGTPEALGALDAILSGRDAQRREAAVLAWLRWQLEIEPGVLSRLRLQIQSDDGQQWLEARSVLLELLEGEGDREALRETLRVAKAAPYGQGRCFESLRVTYRVDWPEPFATRDGLLQSWRSGRLESLRIEREQALNVAESIRKLVEDAPRECGEEGDASPNPNPNPGPTPSVSGVWEEGPASDVLFVHLSGWGGHDNNTFLLRPGLRVTEPGRPETGQPIDVVRDDTLTRVEGMAVWRWSFAGKRRVTRSWIGLEDQDNHLLVGLRGGYFGRLRWGQLMGPEGEGWVHFDRFMPGETQDDAVFVAVDLRGGLEVPDWDAEMDVWLAPTTRAWAAASFEYAEGDTPRRVRAPLIKAWGVDHRTRFVRPLFEQRIEPPEQSAVESVTQARVTSELSDTLQTRLGGTMEVAFHWGEGGVAPGLSLSGGALLSTLIMAEHFLEFEAGYGGVLPLQDSGRVTPSAGAAGVNTQLSGLHGPVFAGRYRWVDGEGDDFSIDLSVTVEQRLRPAGRQGWAARATSGEAQVRLLNPRDVVLFDFALRGLQGDYDLGERADGGPSESDLTIWGADLEFPFYFDELFSVSLRSEGRLAADDSRFNGDFLGQFRISLRVHLFLDELF